MKSSYLVRFDDLCPTMRWSVWEEIERILVERGIRPLLAVVPDNRDERLRLEPARGDFWDRVRSWQARGWTIGMHGFQHQYVMRDRGLFGFDARSEFAGLPWYEQERKVRSAVVIFEREGVRPEVWVAPNHSFDRTTLSVLRDSGLPVVCDGMALYPYVDRRGTVWIPQQLWKFRPRRVGVWTVCLHPNKWTRLGVAAFDMTLAEYGSRLTDVPSVLAVYGDRRQGLVDEWFRAYRRVKRTAKRAILSSPAAPRDRLRAR